jgi:hypothetical protein
MKFTTDEINTLIYSLKWYTLANHNGRSYPTQALSHPHNLASLTGPGGELFMIEIDDLLKMLQDPVKYNNFSCFSDIIHMRALEDLPLYIHDYPEIVAWRLKIAE